jgi:hypothetical protein
MKTLSVPMKNELAHPLQYVVHNYIIIGKWKNVCSRIVKMRTKSYDAISQEALEPIWAVKDEIRHFRSPIFPFSTDQKSITWPEKINPGRSFPEIGVKLIGDAQKDLQKEDEWVFS